MLAFCCFYNRNRKNTLEIRWLKSVDYVQIYNAVNSERMLPTTTNITWWMLGDNKWFLSKKTRIIAQAFTTSITQIWVKPYGIPQIWVNPQIWAITQNWGNHAQITQNWVLHLILRVVIYLLQGTNELMIFLGHQDFMTNELKLWKYLQVVDVMVSPLCPKTPADPYWEQTM